MRRCDDASLSTRHRSNSRVCFRQEERWKEIQNNECSFPAVAAEEQITLNVSVDWVPSLRCAVGGGHGCTAHPPRHVNKEASDFLQRNMKKDRFGRGVCPFTAGCVVSPRAGSSHSAKVNVHRCVPSPPQALLQPQSVSRL